MRRRHYANIAAAMLILGYGAALAGASAMANGASDEVTAELISPVGLCAEARTQTCVIDGDTIRWNGATVRLADIDAPEIFDFDCEAEHALGRQATMRLRDLLNSGPVRVAEAGTRDEDRYGRKLRIVGDGQGSFGNILVTEGLARAWDGARHPWCI